MISNSLNQSHSEKLKPAEVQRVLFFPVRLIGLEPTQPELPDPKSGASTNFATGAWVIICENGVDLWEIKKNLFPVGLAPSLRVQR